MWPSRNAQVALAFSAPICHNYLLIDTRGTGELPFTSLGFAPMMRRVLESLPGGTAHHTVYPAAPDPSQLTTLIGVSDVISVLEAGVRDCPDQVYALLGYSQGATVTNQVLEHYETDSAIGRAVAAVLEIGSPYRLPNRRGNVDEEGGPTTANATGALAYLGITIPETWYETGKVLDVCYTDDLVCNGISVTDLFSPSHIFYQFSESVQRLGFEFLSSKLSHAMKKS